MPQIEGGHAGGDYRLRDVIFKNAQIPDYLDRIAARTSIEKIAR